MTNPRHEEVFDVLKRLEIPYEVLYHPPTPTIEEALLYWKDLEAVHCKNLFFRNHKGNRHYLVIFHCMQQLNIRDLEQRLKQGKLSFASPERMQRYLHLEPGSVSPFGLIHDHSRHVYLFIDENLLKAKKLSFHPNDNTASLSIATKDFIRFLDAMGNGYTFLSLYEDEV
ncbi:MAG: prolyl-tRNA synthetase associated domain-containing protein [Bacteroidales bacterium]|nr:prolyl-tRNA synthetase associated domain-containing protein [Bacteroidales bacterium]MCK9448486.1 prolyl-tRNA synthetase associated domain-containing protein [Bacteroidales bacterium]MDD3701596.1 prolyl-tRNA synthetase associated domain-containing protein [Bacteroidales bacterium]MDY0370207.1 prolyl-tRNA synthetase associated domain-containing protein [Bacteroidales bacterium]